MKVFSTKIKCSLPTNSRKFSPSKVSHYTVWYVLLYIHNIGSRSVLCLAKALPSLRWAWSQQETGSTVSAVTTLLRFINKRLAIMPCIYVAFTMIENHYYRFGIFWTIAVSTPSFPLHTKYSHLLKVSTQCWPCSYNGYFWPEILILHALCTTPHIVQFLNFRDVLWAPTIDRW